MDNCSFDGCEKPVRYQGLCNAHFCQKKAGKTLRPLQVQYHGFTEKRRFLMRVAVANENGCKEWEGSRNKKGWHGQWRNAAGKIELTHRAAWRLFVGEIPDGLCVLHKCDNPICVNPNHLFLGTQADNSNDMWVKGRGKPGKSVGEKHGMSKLNEAIVREIRTSTERGVVLAKKFGVTPTTICDVKKRRIWDHVE